MPTCSLPRLCAQQNYILLLIGLLICSLLTIGALAYPLNPNRILETFLFYVVLHRLAPRLLGILLGISALIVLLYHPTASLYGRPSFGIVASLISTNRGEAWEYLQIIPLSTYASSLALSVLIAVLARCACRIPAPRFGWRCLLPMCAFILIATINTARKPYETGGFALRVLPIEFLADAYLMPKAYFAELDKLNHNLRLPSDWEINQVQQNYRNYVLVIGESVRNDYMSLYGFEVKNTPFLDRHANVVMENVFAPGPNTPISLLHALNLSDGKEFLIQNNLIALAKAAGMRTTWLSNQGALGKYDTSVTAIGSLADEAYFLKTAGYDFGDKTYDNQLLPLLQRTLKQPLPATQNHLIVLHLIGSHPNPCERLQQAPQSYSDNGNTNCYIDSIRATDSLLENINTLLQGSGQSYSLLYFSDHGLTHDKNTYDKNTHTIAQSVLRHNDRYRQNYHIPFVVINSDDDRQIRNPALRGGTHLLAGFSQWLGIRSNNLKPPFDFFSTTPDPKVRMLDMNRQWRALDELENDPLPANIRKLR